MSNRYSRLVTTSYETGKIVLACFIAGRYMRGEVLSGHIFIKSYALAHLLPVLSAYVAAPHKSDLDNLDAFRRFEQTFPELGAELNHTLLQNPLTAACELVDLLDRWLAGRMTDYPQATVETLRAYLGLMQN